MPSTVIYCPLCNCDQFRLLDVRTFLENEVRNVICRKCGFVLQSPRMTPEELDAFYKSQYRLVYQGLGGPTEKDLFIQKNRAANTIERIKPHIASIESHLDIGCSAGLLLQAFQQHFNCRSTGVEPGDEYRRYAEQQGFRLFASLNALEASTPEYFDLVSMMHVLEHLHDPVQVLKDIRSKFIKPGGWLLIEVPNLYAHHSFEIAHLTTFSPHTLRQILLQTGFHVIQLAAHGTPRSKLLPLYLTVIAQPADDKPACAIIPETNVVLKRKLSMLRRSSLQRVAPKQSWEPLPKE